MTVPSEFALLQYEKEIVIIPSCILDLVTNLLISYNEPRCEKTGPRGFRPGPTQTALYSYRIWLEA